MIDIIHPNTIMAMKKITVIKTSIINRKNNGQFILRITIQKKMTENMRKCNMFQTQDQRLDKTFFQLIFQSKEKKRSRHSSPKKPHHSKYQSKRKNRKRKKTPRKKHWKNKDSHHEHVVVTTTSYSHPAHTIEIRPEEHITFTNSHTKKPKRHRRSR